MPKKVLPSSNSRLLVIKRVISLSPNVTLWHGKDLRYQCFIEMQYIIASFSHNLSNTRNSVLYYWGRLIFLLATKCIVPIWNEKKDVAIWTYCVQSWGQKA